MSWGQQFMNRLFSPSHENQAVSGDFAERIDSSTASSSIQTQPVLPSSSRQSTPSTRRSFFRVGKRQQHPQKVQERRDQGNELSRLTLSELSSDAIPNSVFAQPDFLLGAGMIILEHNTWKVVVIQEHNYWFFPKGRKDVGESLEEAALREAYEESGYRASFFPLYTRTRQPSAPEGQLSRTKRNTEAIYISTYAWLARRGPVEYFTHWYVGLIPENAPHTMNTGMKDEKGFKTHLLPLEEAYELVGDVEKKLLAYVRELLKYELEEGAAQDEIVRRLEQVSHSEREAVVDVI